MRCPFGCSKALLSVSPKNDPEEKKYAAPPRDILLFCRYSLQRHVYPFFQNEATCLIVLLGLIAQGPKCRKYTWRCWWEYFKKRLKWLSGNFAYWFSNQNDLWCEFIFSLNWTSFCCSLYECHVYKRLWNIQNEHKGTLHSDPVFSSLLCVNGKRLHKAFPPVPKRCKPPGGTNLSGS